MIEERDEIEVHSKQSGTVVKGRMGLDAWRDSAMDWHSAARRNLRRKHLSFTLTKPFIVSLPSRSLVDEAPAHLLGGRGVHLRLRAHRHPVGEAVLGRAEGLAGYGFLDLKRFIVTSLVLPLCFDKGCN